MTNVKKAKGKTVGKTPYQGELRCFGHFKCPTCLKTWKSGNSWANAGQECKSCNILVYPHRQKKLEKHGGDDDDEGLRPQHPRHLCDKCQDIGRYCGKV
ncbi:Zinc finger CCHC domain-containing protein 24 [Halotydeus destructor]|nr:Zinc finger CCHC domain-containing protein 24 [Halotydeus destructor]